jgi:hypothetical protein
VQAGVLRSPVKESSIRAICIRVLFLLPIFLALGACNRDKQTTMSDQKEGSGGDAAGRSVQPRSESPKDQAQGRERQTVKTVPAPGVPASKEEMERLKREAERPSDSTQRASMDKP